MPNRARPSLAARVGAARRPPSGVTVRFAWDNTVETGHLQSFEHAAHSHGHRLQLCAPGHFPDSAHVVITDRPDLWDVGLHGKARVIGVDDAHELIRNIALRLPVLPDGYEIASAFGLDLAPDASNDLDRWNFTAYSGVDAWIRKGRRRRRVGFALSEPAGLHSIDGGMVLLKATAHDRLKLSFLKVGDAHTGRGHGRQLLALASACAELNGYSSLYVTIKHDRTDVRSFFTTHGFTESGFKDRTDEVVLARAARMGRQLETLSRPFHVAHVRQSLGLGV